MKIAEPAVGNSINLSGEEETKIAAVEKRATRELLAKNKRGSAISIAPLGRDFIGRPGRVSLPAREIAIQKSHPPDGAAFLPYQKCNQDCKSALGGLDAFKPEDPGNRGVPALMD